MFEGGGFGVGSDSEYGASFRVDWKPVRHFGLTAGYSLLNFKISQDVANRTFVAKQTLHGPHRRVRAVLLVVRPRAGLRTTI